MEAMHETNPDSLASVASDYINLLQLVRFRRAEIITVKHLIQGGNNEVWVGVEPSTMRSWSS